MFKRIISYGLILAGVLSISSFEIVKAAENKRLAANSSFSISDNWQYQKLYGKDFWLVVYYQPENWAKAGMDKEPFLTESCYRIPFPDKGTSLYKKLLSIDNPIMLERGKMAESVFDEFKKDFKERYLYTAQLMEWTWMCEPKKVWKRLTEKYNVPMPETRKAAHELLFKGNAEDGLCWDKFMLFGGLHDYPGHKMCTLNATFQQHIEGASNLVHMIGPEIGTCDNRRSPMQVIFSRGASRQYQKPWVSYIACWSSGCTNFKVPHPRCRFGTAPRGPYCGPSHSQGKRLLYLSYMGGASLIMHESDISGEIFSANYDYKAPVDPLVSNLRGDKKWYISPIGAYWKELYDKVVKKHDRGIPYTPIGLLFDQYHGYIYNSYGAGRRACLALIPFTDADYMGRAIINTLHPHGKGDEGTKFSPNPLTGDIFDAITNTSSLSNLQNYPVIFTSGNVDIDKGFAKKLIKYVREGGTLFINTSQQIKHFPKEFLGVKLTEEKCEGSSFKSLLDNSLVKEEDKFSFTKVIPTVARVLVVEPESGFSLVTENVYGAHGGKLILTTPDYLYVKGSENRMLKLFPYLIRKISCELLPFSLEGEVEYLVNKTKNSIIITILNNKVTKAPLEKAVVKPEDTEKVRITFKRKEKRIKKGKEWLSGERIPMSGSIFKVTVPAGEVRIVEFRK